MTTPPLPRLSRILRRLAPGLVPALFAASALAEPFDIPAQPAAAALQLFIKQSGREVIYPFDELQKVTANAVTGELEPAVALDRLLAHTGFAARQSRTNQFVVAAVAAKPGALEGSVREARSARPVEGARVALVGTEQAAVTDRHGRFAFAEVPAGEHVLMITADGMQDTRVTDVTVSAGHRLSLSAIGLPARQEGPVRLEPYSVSAKKNEGVLELDPYAVTGNKEKPFATSNVDLPRTINDVQAYYIFDSVTVTQAGAVNTEDFLKQRLSMNTNALSNGQAYLNNYGNTSTVNLRGIGTDSTLILINGREQAGVSNTLTIGQTDLNSIPLEAIDRIEVLPSSASAIYGAKALGGVINVILKSHYSGGTFTTSYENPEKSDAPIRSASLTFGRSLADGKTQITFVARYADGKGLLVGDRPELVQRGIDEILQNQPGNLYSTTAPFYGGTLPNIALYASSYKAPGSASAYTNPSTTALTLKDGTSLGSRITSVPVGANAGSDLSAGLLAHAGSYNTTLGPDTGRYGLNNQLGWTPSRAKTLMGTLSRQLRPGLELYSEFSLESNLSAAIYNPLTYYRMAGNAPNNPFQQNIYITLPANLDAPLVNNTITRSITVGAKADLPHDWKGQMDYTWSRTVFTLDLAVIDSSGIEAALQSGALNPFVDTIAHPLDLESYLAPVHYDFATTLGDFGLRASGPLARFAWGTPNLAVGLKHQRQGLSQGSFSAHYPITTTSDYTATYFGHAATTDSAYAELNLPLVGTKNARPFLRELEFQFAGRADYFTVDTGTIYRYFYPATSATTLYPTSATGEPYASRSRFHSANPTAGFKYSPGGGVTLRASYAKAFVPPTFVQLVPNQVKNTSQTTVLDPTTGTTYGVDTISGGNPDLKPRTSDSFTAGLIYEPRNLPALAGLRVDLEYYQIRQFDYITTLAAQDIVSDPDYASRVTRDATTGLITLVDTSYVNVNEYKTSGWDLTVSWQRRTPVGTFAINATGTYVLHDLRQLTFGGPFIEYTGAVNEGGPGKRKASATVTWQKGPLQLGWSATYYDSYKQYGAAGGPYNQRYGTLYTYYTGAQGSDTIPSQTYHNLFASYNFSSRGEEGASRSMPDRLLKGTTLQFGIKNVFNKVPPFDAYRSPFFYSSYGDPRLRSYWISLKKEF